MKTDKISFGTKPQIGDIAASCALSKYKKVLTDGLFDAFEKLSKKNISKFIIDSYEKLTKSDKKTT